MQEVGGSLEDGACGASFREQVRWGPLPQVAGLSPTHSPGPSGLSRGRWSHVGQTPSWPGSENGESCQPAAAVLPPPLQGFPEADFGPRAAQMQKQLGHNPTQASRSCPISQASTSACLCRGVALSRRAQLADKVGVCSAPPACSRGPWWDPKHWHPLAGGQGHTCPPPNSRCSIDVLHHGPPGTHRAVSTLPWPQGTPW